MVRNGKHLHPARFQDVIGKKRRCVTIRDIDDLLAQGRQGIADSNRPRRAIGLGRLCSGNVETGGDNDRSIVIADLVQNKLRPLGIAVCGKIVFQLGYASGVVTQNDRFNLDNGSLLSGTFFKDVYCQRMVEGVFPMEGIATFCCKSG